MSRSVASAAVGPVIINEDRYPTLDRIEKHPDGRAVQKCLDARRARTFKSEAYRQAVQKCLDARRAKIEERGVYEKYVER